MKHLPNAYKRFTSLVSAIFTHAAKTSSLTLFCSGDLIWIHDYHLLLVPSLLRQALPDAAVGLFVHTPFPSSEVFRSDVSAYPNELSC